MFCSTRIVPGLRAEPNHLALFYASELARIVTTGDKCHTMIDVRDRDWSKGLYTLHVKAPASSLETRRNPCTVSDEEEAEFLVWVG